MLKDEPMSSRKGQALGSIFGAASRRGAVPQAQNPPAAAPAVTVSPALAAFLAIVERVEAVLDAETEVLTHNLPTDISDLGHRKRQGLLEMTRIMRIAASSGAQVEMRERLGRFSAKLERNRAVLGTQLRAVREIADIIALTIRDSDSDGTYSRRTGRS